MALITQTATCGIESGTYQDYIPFTPRQPFGPIGRTVWRGTFTLDSTGAGDTAVCILTLPLAANQMHVLEGCVIQVSSDDLDYDEAKLKWYYQPQDPAYKPVTELDFPICFGDDVSTDGGANDTKWGSIALQGTAAGNGGGVWAQSLDPTNFPSWQNDVNGDDPKLYIGAGSQAAVADAQLRFHITALSFSPEVAREYITLSRL